MIRRVLLALICVAALTACRLDVTVDVAVDPDGTGQVVVTGVADAGLMEQVPDLADDLRLEDAIANGWTVTGPTFADDGGATIVLSYDVTSADELASVLNSIGPPLTLMAAARTSDDTGQVTNAINGEMVLANGFESFADDDLVARVGGLPFADLFAANGLTPAEAMSFTYRVSLPGELVSSTGTELDNGVIEWRAPLDGTSQSLYTETVQRPPGSGNSWAAPLATVARFALMVWLVVSALVIAVVVWARRQRRRRRERAVARLKR